MRILIVGGGEIGSALARALAPGHEVVVIDQEPRVADRFTALDVEFILGGGTSEDVLRRAGIEQARFFIACTGLDEVNIVACAIANRLGNNPETICFVSREDFLTATTAGSGLEAFGIDRVLWPEAQLAADIERVVTTPGAIDAEVFAGGVVRLLEYRLEVGGPLASAEVSGLHLPRGSLIVAVTRNGRIFVPRGSTRLEAGDKIIFMGTQEAMREVEARVFPDVRRRQRVTIIGGGDVGLQLATRLEAFPDIELRIVEHSPARATLLAARLARALVLTGDGTDMELLESEDIGRSDVIVSVIDNDERNLLTSLLGRQLGVRKVVTRVSRPANLALFERVGIDVALSARGAAVAAVLHQVAGRSASLLAVVEHGEARVIEMMVPAGFVPRALKSIGAPEDAIVAAILRGQDAIVPRGDDTIQPGDRLLVFATLAASDRVHDFFSGAGA